jgi:hypothetical protein
MQPNNPIVGGNALRIPAIQSPNFVPGVSGWQIKQDGSASFEDVTINAGSLTIVGSSGGVFVYSGTPALGNLITSIAGAAGTDAYGNAYPEGFTSTNASGDSIQITPSDTNGLPAILWTDHTHPGDRAIAYVDSGELNFTSFTFTSPDFGNSIYGAVRASNEIILGFYDSTTNAGSGAFVQVNDNSVYLGITPPSGGGNSQLVQITQNNILSTLPVQVGAWANVSFGSGWSNFGSGYSSAQWRLCSDGFIHFRGLITVTAAPADNTLAFAIPLAGEPPANKEIPLMRINGAAAASACRLNVTVGGGQVNFNIFGAGTGTNFSLEDCFYESNTYMA